MRDRYWHGGAPGLKVGDFLLPPSITSAKNTLTGMAEELGADHVRTDRVFVTTQFDGALFFAAGYPTDHGGWIYLVEPEGLEPDPDCIEPGLSYQCARARILEVHRPMPADVRAVRSMLEQSIAEVRHG